HVHITFDDQHAAFAADARAGLPQAIQLAALGKQGCFGRIQVFGLALADDPAAEPDELAPTIPNRKHHPFTKAAVTSPIFRLDDQAALDQHRIFIVGEYRGQTAPVFSRPAPPETSGNLATQAPALQVLDRTRRTLEARQIKIGRAKV